MPKISVIIPLYNKENYILKTLESVLNQTFKDFEIIVIDDGSTDNSVNRILIHKDKFKLLSQKNHGVSVARNLGIETAQTDLIAFLDADDIWENNHLESLFNLSTNFKQAEMFCSRYTFVLSNKLKVKTSYIGIAENYEGFVDDFFLSSIKYRVALTSALMVRKETLKKAGLFNPLLKSGQDLEMWIKIALSSQVAISKYYTVIYQSNIKQSLSNLDPKIKTFLDFKQFKELEQNNPSLKIFLDLYRLEYGINLKRVRKKQEAEKLFKEIDYKHLPLKSKLLINCPSFILQILFYFKQFTKKMGINLGIN